MTEKYMLRCIDLARSGQGNTAPNPMVGAVIVHDGAIIGEGFHGEFGKPHAEVNAINAVRDKSLLRRSTLYVSLEPCAHHGKTPPCADLIISCGIPHVVIGSVDPFAAVAGRGIEMMKNAGIAVDVGILEEECMWLNRRFFTFHLYKRPYMILKWAQTADGFMGVRRSPQEAGMPVWISNELSRRAVHRQRSEEAAIMIGANTAVDDDPSLTVREWAGSQPVRLVLDRQGRVPAAAKVKDGRAPTIIFTDHDHDLPGNCEYVKLDFDGDIIAEVQRFLYERQIQSVIVEGGRRLLQSFIDQGAWDEAHVYIGNVWWGDGIPAPRLNRKPAKCEMLDETRLLCFYGDINIQGGNK